MLTTVLCVSICLIWDSTYPYSWGAQMIIIKSRNAWHFWHQTFICTVYMIYPSYCVVVCICEYQWHGSSVFSCSMLCACFILMDLCTLCIYDVLQVLFDKLCLHEQCKNKKLPKTLNKQQQSTSEAAVRRTQTHWSCQFQSLALFHLPSQCLHLSICSVFLCIQFKKNKWEEHAKGTRFPRNLSFHLDRSLVLGVWLLPSARSTWNLIVISNYLNLFCRCCLKFNIIKGQKN